jgi:hypothetical protein
LIYFPENAAMGILKEQEGVSMTRENEARFRRIVMSNVERYPLMECDDLYKLMFQAAMGSSHGVTGEEAVRTKLYSEMDDLPDGPDEPALDVISDDGSIARVNLRPFKTAGGYCELLIHAFLRTANEFRGSWKRLEDYRELISGMAMDGELTRGLLEIDSYLLEMRDSGYPAVHHSKKYTEAYRPAYRVVMSEFAEEFPIFQ